MVQVEPLPLSAAPQRGLVPGPFDKDATHGLGRGGEEMTPTVPVLGLVLLHKPEIGLVDESGGLEGLPRRFMGQLLSRQLPQFLVD